MEKLKPNISSEAYKALINANIRSLSQIITHTKSDLAQITKLNINCVEEILKECSVIILTDRIHTANNLPKWQRISTGCSSIDTITKGGICLKGITEIFGCSGVGKTQLCLQLSIMTQLPVSLGGLEKSVVYICTEDVFPVKRLNELAREFSNKYKDLEIHFEDNIFIEHAADIEQLKKCLTCLHKLLSVKTVGLIIIDSIAGVFRSENLNVKYSNRSQVFISIATTLSKLSEKHGFAVVCVNQVADSATTGNTEPCLGLAWSNLVSYRFNISRHMRNHIREFEVVFAPDVPNGMCKFSIKREGLKEV